MSAPIDGGSRISGGGGVFFVTRGEHRYMKDIETREESGTADIGVWLSLVNF